MQYAINYTSNKEYLSMQSRPTKQTRGRPKKNDVKTLSNEYRLIFTEHMAVSYGLALMYVMEIWAETKQEKRIGHSQGSFTVYDKISDDYAFDSYAKDLQVWGFEHIQKDYEMNRFCRNLVGLAPKFVLREIIVIIEEFLKIRDSKESSIAALNDVRKLYSETDTYVATQLNKDFKYIRFTPEAAMELKCEKWIELFNKKVRQLWPVFIDMFSYCLFCVSQGKQSNKYNKPLFSDAANPDETLTGQLTLHQIVSEVIRDQFEEEIKKPDIQTQSFQLYKGGSHRNQLTRIFQSPDFLIPPQQNRLSHQPAWNRHVSEVVIPSQTSILHEHNVEDKRNLNSMNRKQIIILKKEEPVKSSAQTFSLTSLLQDNADKLKQQVQDVDKGPVFQKQQSKQLEFEFNPNDLMHSPNQGMDQEEEAQQKMKIEEQNNNQLREIVKVIGVKNIGQRGHSARIPSGQGVHPASKELQLMQQNSGIQSEQNAGKEVRTAEKEDENKEQDDGKRRASTAGDLEQQEKPRKMRNRIIEEQE